MSEAFWQFASLGWRQARRVVVFVLGMTVLILGVLMIVAPGPAILVIPAGLAILATEFVWARRWLRAVRRRAQTIKDAVFSHGSQSKQARADADAKADKTEA